MLSTVTQGSVNPLCRGTNRTTAVPERSTKAPLPAPILAPPPAFPPPVPPGEEVQSSQGPPSPEHFLHNTLYCRSLRPPVSRGRSHSKFTDVPLTEEMTFTGADGGPGDKKDRRLSSFTGLIHVQKSKQHFSGIDKFWTHHSTAAVAGANVFVYIFLWTDFEVVSPVGLGDLVYSVFVLTGAWSCRWVICGSVVIGVAGAGEGGSGLWVAVLGTFTTQAIACHRLIETHLTGCRERERENK